jgi:hypothetical protein
LSVVDPAVIVASVQVEAASPFRVRAALMAVRSSLICTAFTSVVPATKGLSVKPPLVLAVKVAVIACAALIVAVHVPVPEQPPLQPVKVEPAAGVAVSVTAVPEVKEVEQVAPQEIPAGELVTVPLPVPALATVSAKDDCTKLAVTVVAAFTVTAHVPVPEQPPPLQPLNVEPAAGAAVRVTTAPLA